MCSRTGNIAGGLAAAEAGFTLLEMVCVLGIVGLLAAVLLPAIPKQTTRARLEAYAIEAAALLQADRNAAIRRRREVATRVDPPSRSVHSGASGQTVRVPDDVRFEALLPRNCDSQPVVSAISFFASGMSCGGVIALTHLDASYEIRVNWLTGRIDVVPSAGLANR
jgi:general secretion pathway protein H